MNTPSYTNAEFRSILCGLGYLASQFVRSGTGFPVTSDDSSLAGEQTIKAIKAFQERYGLEKDGIVGPITRGKAAQVISILQDELNCLVKAGLPSDQPFYGSRTFAAVKKAQAFFQLPQDGVATLTLRQKIHNYVQQHSCVA